MLNIKNYLECNAIDEAYNLINLLSSPITNYYNAKLNKTSIYSLWTKYTIELFNNRTEFLLSGEISIDGKYNDDIKLLSNNSYIDNYNLFKQKIFYQEKNRDKNIILNKTRISPQNSTFFENDFNITLDDKECYEKLNHSISKCYDLNQYKKSSEIIILGHKEKLKTVVNNINECIIYEEKQKETNDKLIYILVCFVYQYLNIFEDSSVNLNMWNYCLRSIKLSKKYLIIGIVTIICQYLWTFALTYNFITNYNPNYEPIVILITVISSLISALYSYDTMSSFWSSRQIYNFLFNFYDEFPELLVNINKDNNKLNYYKRKITMTKSVIYWNYFADFSSNFILPFTMPIINFFVVINSDNLLEASLNSMAIFFIIQIDEELYTITSYENDKQMNDFAKWAISTLYSKINNNFNCNFRQEYETCNNHIFSLACEYKTIMDFDP
jgi:hypothetical protein